MKSLILKLKNLFKPIEKNSDGFHSFDELYEHRIALFIALLHKTVFDKSNNKCWKSRLNSDGTKWKGWIVAGIDKGITYHIPEKYWSKIKVPEIKRGLWDGHTSKDVVERLLKLK